MSIDTGGFDTRIAALRGAPKLHERPVIIPPSCRSYNWKDITAKDSLAARQIQRLTNCSFKLREFGTELYVVVTAKKASDLSLGAQEIDNIIWNVQRQNQFDEQVEVETVPADLFKSMATEPTDIWSLGPATAFKDEEQKGPGEIVWLPSEKLGLILGKKHKTLLEIRSLTNTEIKMEDAEGQMTKFMMWGREEDKKRAKVMLAESMQHIPPLHPGQVTELFDIPSAKIGHVIGPQGQMIKAMQGKAGCFIKVFDDARVMVRGEPDRVIHGVGLVRKIADLPPLHLNYDKEQEKAKNEGPPGIAKKAEDEVQNFGTPLLNTEKSMKLVVPAALSEKLLEMDLGKLESEFGVTVAAGYLPSTNTHELLIEGQVGTVKACKMRIDRHFKTTLREDIEMIALPRGWQTFTDPTSNKPYYHHKPTGHTTWNHPHSDEYRAEYELLKGNQPKSKEEIEKDKEVAVVMKPNRRRKAKNDDKLPQIVSIIRADGKMIVKRPREPDEELPMMTMSSSIDPKTKNQPVVLATRVADLAPKEHVNPPQNFIGPVVDPLGPNLNPAQNSDYIYEPMPLQKKKQSKKQKQEKKSKKSTKGLGIQEQAMLAVLRQKKKCEAESESARSPKEEKAKSFRMEVLVRSVDRSFREKR